MKETENKVELDAELTLAQMKLEETIRAAESMRANILDAAANKTLTDTLLKGYEILICDRIVQSAQLSKLYEKRLPKNDEISGIAQTGGHVH